MVFTPRSPNLQVFFAQKMEILLSRAVENTQRRGKEVRNPWQEGGRSSQNNFHLIRLQPFHVWKGKKKRLWPNKSSKSSLEELLLFSMLSGAYLHPC